MIRGKFYTSLDAVEEIFDIRRRVFVDEQGFSLEGERDAYDDMAVYALVFDENDVPSGTGRLFIDKSDHFVIGRVCTLREARGQGLGDLIMRMLLYRAQEMNAPAVYISAQLEAVAFYARYGFEPYGEIVLDEGVPHRLMRATAEQINIEGTCGGRHPCAGCEKSCEACQEAREG